MAEAAAETATAPKAKLEPGNVWCRVTRIGNDKIFTGQTGKYGAGEDYDGTVTFPRHKANDIIQLPQKIAQQQEDLGHLEIQE